MWTVLGGLAIPLWATWPALSLQTRGMPPLECLGIAFLVAWVVSIPLERRLSSAGPVLQSRRSWMVAAAFGAAEVGSAGFFLIAIRHIPAAEANLIVYLWPGIVIFLGAALGMFRLRPRHIAGIAIGFLGVVILVGIDQLTASAVGISLALLAGLSWALYCVLRLRWRSPTGPLLARGFAMAALLCAVLHGMFEHTLLPSFAQAAAAAGAGIVPSAIANVAWDEGFRKGDSQLLTVMAYATPLCSALLLTLMGVEALTGRLLMGALAIVAAGLMSRSDTLPVS